MCGEFIKRMENHQGDLTDMLRGIAGDWQFVSNPVNYPSDPSQDFGDPFTQLGDPLLQDRDAPVFQGVENSVLFSGGADVNNGHKYFEHEEMKLKPSNIFSRMLQISPTPAKLQLPPRESIASALAASAASPGGLKGGAMLVPNNIMDHRGLINSPNSSKSCLIENPAGIQIPPPRNTGIKRRKSQSKKVVCIPAPAPVNSRPSGEVVPSDLWAWRKYGQKPIKGSPYPRGYYRCSSSKGCSARRQVERSRTDPNMLLITYTSEHNHPWPTQRNALAGSTRTHQPTKTATTPKFPQKQTDPKEEPKDTTTQNPTADPIPTVLVKQEKDTSDFEMNDAINAGYRQCYKPVFLESLNIQTGDSFFADLGEIEPDPLDLLFTEGFSGGDDPDNKALDPFTFYDWAGTNGGSATTSIAGESKMDS